MAGASMAAVGLVAGAIFERGSLSASLLVVAVVLSICASAGYLLRPATTRHPPVIRSDTEDQGVSSNPGAQQACVPRQSRLR